MPRSFRGTVCAISIACAFTVAAPARADEPTGPGLAQSLFEAGRALMDEGKPELACPKFEESNRVDASAGTLLNLGKCFEALGRTASALSSYQEAAIIGKSAGKARQVAAAEEFIAAIEPKLSKLTVRVLSRAPGLVVERTALRPGSVGVALPDANRGVPVVVDPGDYRVDAKAPGYRSWSRAITVGPDADAKTIEVPELILSSGGRTPTVPLKPLDAHPTSMRPLRIAAITTGGVGVVLVVVGATLGGLTLADASTAETDPTLCPNKKCTPKGEEFVDGARTKGIVSTVGFAVGGAAVAAGAVMFVLSLGDDHHGVASKPKVSSGLRVAPLALPGATFGAPPPIGVTLGGIL